MIALVIITQAIEWAATRSPEVVATNRERMIAAIEEIDVETRQFGLCQCWFGDADVHTRAVADGANGYLFQTLLRASGYADVNCANLLREGGGLYASKRLDAIFFPVSTFNQGQACLG